MLLSDWVKNINILDSYQFHLVLQTNENTTAPAFCSHDANGHKDKLLKADIVLKTFTVSEENVLEECSV